MADPVINHGRSGDQPRLHRLHLTPELPGGDGVSAGGSIDLQGCVREDGKPFVLTIVNGELFGQLSPGEALNFGIRAIQAAQEAERDAALLIGARRAGFNQEAALGLLQMIRDNRGQVDPDPREDVQGRSTE